MMCGRSCSRGSHRDLGRRQMVGTTEGSYGPAPGRAPAAAMRGQRRSPDVTSRRRSAAGSAPDHRVTRHGVSSIHAARAADHRVARRMGVAHPSPGPTQPRHPGMSRTCPAGSDDPALHHRAGLERRWRRNIHAIMSLHISALALDAMSPAEQPLVMVGLAVVGGCIRRRRVGRLDIAGRPPHAAGTANARPQTPRSKRAWKRMRELLSQVHAQRRATERARAWPYRTEALKVTRPPRPS